MRQAAAVAVGVGVLVVCAAVPGVIVATTEHRSTTGRYPAATSTSPIPDASDGEPHSGPWVDFVDRQLRYARDAQGNRVPDFSQVGYHGANAALPIVPVAVTLPATGSADDTSRIQAAVNQAALTGTPHAVLLGPGTFRLAGTVHVSGSGVVLAGSGSGAGGTVLVGTGSPHVLVRLGGSGAATPTGPTHTVTDNYVPVGSRTFTLDETTDLKPGDRVIVQRPITQTWIHAIGMDAIAPRTDGGATSPWQPTSGLKFDRTIERVASHTVTLNAPLPQALERQYATATVRRYTYSGRISEVALENVSGDGHAFESDPGWHAGGYFTSGLVTVDAAQDSWVSNVVAHHFGSAFSIGANAIRVSVLDTASLDESVPQDVRAQPAAYTINGQLSLVRNCQATGTNFHAWTVEDGTAGPDVYSRCTATNTGTGALDAGPIQRWAVGILFDDVTMDASGYLSLEDGGSVGTGRGWAGANSVLWNCTVGSYRVEQPPTAHNWVFGCQGRMAPPHPGHRTGAQVSPGSSLSPTSLYDEQLAERIAAGGFPSD